MITGERYEKEITGSRSVQYFGDSDRFLPAGAEVIITATNYGIARHNFIIFNKGLDEGEHFDHEDDVNIYWQVEFQPGQSTKQTFTAPDKPGEYFVAGGAMSHMEDGMVATLIVTK